MTKTIVTRYGQLEVFENDVISDFLTIYGEWAQLEINFFCEIFKQKDIKIFDLGAFIGTFSLGVSEQLEHARILSVEMSDDSYELLKKNIVRNCSGVISENIAVSCSSNGVYFEASDKNRGESSVLIDPSENITKEFSKSTTLKKLGEKFFIPDVIKLDLEGHELDVLRGGTNWLKDYKPSLWLECNENKKTLEVLDWLLWMKYEVFYFAFPSYNKDNFNKEENLIFPIAYEAALIALPNKEIELAFEPGKFTDCLFYKVDSKEKLRYALFNTPRWGEDNWASLTINELLGVLSHRVSGIDFEDFLR